MTQIFLTGVTGFVGKVVLEELIRCRGEIGFEKVFVLIRPGRRGETPQGRFDKEVKASPCFSRLPADWSNCVEVVAGDLSKADFLSARCKTLIRNVTHIINCAASVEFDLPLAQAVEANVTSALHVLELARLCERLVSMVSVSTAYVTPHPGGKPAIGEMLVKLPRPAEEIYASILNGTADEKTLLAETGHPNTYTYTKCLAEHLLVERKGDVPLTIVRPSIVSACWRHPFPGWIDSRAAFAGFVALIGSGRLRAVVAQYSTYLDVVPCDEVADKIIRAVMDQGQGTRDKGPKALGHWSLVTGHWSVPIIHAACGLEKSSRIDMCISVIEDFFRRHPVDRYPHLRYVGADTFRFKIKHWRYHRAPAFIGRHWFGLRGKERQRRMVVRLREQLNYLNEGFPYFTHNTFDFESSMPLEAPQFQPGDYIETVCRGVYRHLMMRDETEMLIGGREYKSPEMDIGWTIRQPKGNWVIRLFAYGVRKGLRKCTNKVTFDRPSFEAAQKAASKESLLVIVPTHRSYLDFVLCSYLFFSRSDLGISIPHIAAAREFAKIPVLGWLFRKTHAFYVKRGLGRENADLTRQVHELVARRHTFEFFIEGTRSRSRQLLKPKRGMLKSLQSSGQKFTILPVAITYDRVPEEAAFMRELQGGDKPHMRLRVLVGWLWRLFRGKIDIGPIHMNCGKPLILDSTSDVTSLGREVMGELQLRMATTTHHLRSFLWHNPVEGIDVEWLKNAIVRRGGQVIESPLVDEEAVDPVVEKSMRYQWMHWFYKEASLLYPEHPVILHHIATNSYLSLDDYRCKTELDDLRIRRLVRALFEPICQDYWTAAENLSDAQGTLSRLVSHAPTPRDIVRRHTSAHLPTLEAAFDYMVQQQILLPVTSEERYVWGPKVREIENHKARMAKEI
ncbi:MAG: SDR family oxidoreductase [Deltaproteobacteria bacterium]|nr:SDR family oxidoreductase [Deltaproteobacteria bacterium]